MRRTLEIVDGISARLALVAACAATLIMVSFTLLVLVEITLRSFFASSTQILEEYVGYGLGTMIFLGLGHALRQGALVRVDLVLGRLSAPVRRGFEIVICVVTLGVMAFLVNFFLISVERNFVNGTISMTRAATPIWIPEGIVVLGMIIFILQLVVYLLRLCVGGALIDDSGRAE